MRRHIVLFISLCVSCFLCLTASAGPAATVPPASNTMPAIPPAGLTIPLPGTIADVGVGGDGRYLLLWLKDVAKIAVFDLSTLKVKFYIPVDGSNISFAASGSKLYVAVNDQSIIQSWDLASGHCNLTQMLPDGLEVRMLAISQIGSGPLAASMSDRHVLFIDPTTLSVENARYKDPVIDQTGFPGYNIRAAADTESFVGWIQGTNYGLDVFDGSGAAIGEHGNPYSMGANYFVPSLDGRYVFSDCGVFNNTLDKLDIDAGSSLPVYGASGYFVGLRQLNGKPGETITIYTTNDRRLLVNLPRSINMGMLDNDITTDKRIIFFANYDAMVLIPASKDQIDVCPFNIRDALAEAGIDYLYVYSLPPSQFTPGTLLTYQIAAASRQGNITYHLDSGPSGMSITQSGLVSWKPDSKNPDREDSVIVSIKDASGKEIFHTFKLANSLPPPQPQAAVQTVQNKPKSSVVAVAAAPVPHAPVTAPQSASLPQGAATTPKADPNGPDLTGKWTNLEQDTTGAGKNLLATLVGAYEVQNIGKSAAPKSKLRFYLAVNESDVIEVNDLYESDQVIENIKGVVLLQEVWVPALPPGGTFEADLNAPLDVGEDDEGQYVVAEVNSEMRFAEANYDNNDVQLQIR